MFNSPRIAADTDMAKYYSNNVLTSYKRGVLQMTSFNRKFLPSEIEQFLFNENLQKKGRKRYIYNPKVHGEDEAEFKQWFRRMNSGKYDFSNRFYKQIEQANEAKLKEREIVQLVPWRADLSLN